MNKQDIMELIEQLKLKENLDVIANGFKAQLWTNIVISSLFLVISLILAYKLYSSYKKETDFVDTFEDSPAIAITYICSMILFGGGGILGLISNIPSLILWDTSPLAALIKLIGRMI